MKIETMQQHVQKAMITKEVAKHIHMQFTETGNDSNSTAVITQNMNNPYSIDGHLYKHLVIQK